MEQNPGGRLGYAWNAPVLGRAVLFGLIPPEHMPHAKDPFAIGVGIGEQDLHAGIVVVRPDRRLVVVGTDQTPGAAGMTGLDSEYESLADVPADVPVY